LERQTKALNAIERVKSLIEKYKKELMTWEENYSWDFNLLHDLQYRLEERANEIWMEHGNWNFETKGFNAY